MVLELDGVGGRRGLREGVRKGPYTFGVRSTVSKGLISLHRALQRCNGIVLLGAQHSARVFASVLLLSEIWHALMKIKEPDHRCTF